MNLRSLLEQVEYTCLQGSLDTEVTAVINDSRKLVEGCLFLCIKGASFDGHTFAREAVEAGASVLVVQDDVDVPADITVIRVGNTRKATIANVYVSMTNFMERTKTSVSKIK